MFKHRQAVFCVSQNTDKSFIFKQLPYETQQTKNMINYKKEILDKICYTELVYERINKKLDINLSKEKIETMIFEIIKETDQSKFQKTGKNIYITNNTKNIRLTINSNTKRIITVDKLHKKAQ